MLTKNDNPKAAWWNYCDGPNFAVFDALDVNGNQPCADYYAAVGGGNWPYISTDEPDWEDKMRAAMLGLAQYGAEVVVTYPDGKQYKSDKRFQVSEHTPTSARETVEDLVGDIKVTWSPEEKKAIKKYLKSLIKSL